MSRLFDTHAHYTDETFTGLEGGADALLRKLFDGEVGNIINVGTNAANSAETVKMAAEYENMYAAVGIHPEDAQQNGDIDAELEQIESMLEEKDKNKIVAIGEVGFDFHWEPYDIQIQHKVFEAQMKLAQKYGLPVIIHDREAHGACFDMIRAFPGVKGVFHSYSGSPELALEIVKRGWYISFSGVLTFKNARRLPEVAALIPACRILVETDCPYMAPVPYRGKVNHSGLMAKTVEKLAELTGMTYRQTVDLTAENAAELFGIRLG